MKNRLFYLFIALIFVVITLAPYSVYALVRQGEGEAVLLQEGEFDIPEYDESMVTKTRGSATVESAIYNALITCAYNVDLSSYGISVDDFSAVYSNVINDNPDLFYVSSSYNYNYYQSNNTVAYLYPEYTMTSSEIQSAMAVFNEGAQKALERVDSSMNDLQKALVLHDYVCSLAHYPDVDLNTEDKAIYHSAYGLFYDTEIVCAGYTLVYSYLMNQAGVPCEYVSSDSMEHAWNKVRIGGQWYNTDLTWDDNDANSSISVFGSLSHNHFLKSDSAFETQACSFHYDGMTADNCTATSTLYDSAFWDDIFGSICVADGDFYYINPDYTNRKIYLTRRTLSGAENNLAAMSLSVNLSGYSVVYDRNGQSYSNPYKDPLSRLTYLDNRLYLVTAKKIYSYSLSGQQYLITNVSNYCSGFGYNNDYNLIYQYYNAPDTVYELDKMAYYNLYFTIQKGVNYNNYPDINYDLVINAKDYAMLIKQ